MSTTATIAGGVLDDTLVGGTDSESLYGNEGNDLLQGNGGNDELFGWTGNDTLEGGEGDDTLGGDADDDLLLGDAGNDFLYGATENDTLNGGTGTDTLDGASGADVYVFEAGHTGIDYVVTFEDEVDKFDVSDFNITESELNIFFNANSFRTEVKASGTDLHFTLFGDRTADLSAEDFIFDKGNNPPPPDPDPIEIIYAPMLGQSNASAMYYYGTDGDQKSGMTEFQDRLSALTDKTVIGVVTSGSGNIENPAMGGSTVDGDYDSVLPDRVWWYPDSQQPGQALTRAVSIMQDHYAELQLQGNVSKITMLWSQGENNAWLIGTSSDRDLMSQRYLEATEAIFDYIKEALPGANIEFYMMHTPLVEEQAAINGGLSAARVQDLYEGGILVQQKQSELAASRDDIHLAANTDDLPSAFDAGEPGRETDKWHLANDSYEIAGGRLAEYVAGDLDADPPIPPVGRLFEGDAGDNTLTGTSEDDTLDGGAGQDNLTGGNGADIFRFSDIAHSIDDNAANNNQYDRILDFEVGVDQIDLTGLGFFGFDADGGTTEAGELRLAVSNSGRTYLKSDQTGFSVQLNGDYSNSLTAGDIIWDDAPATPSASTAFIIGSVLDDTLSGGDSAEIINGGLGEDKLIGGDGGDIFTFTSLLDSLDDNAINNNRFDRIADFKVGDDQIDLSGLGFTGLDTDGGGTESGELRILYSSNSDRTYIKTDQSDFGLYLNGDYRTTLSNADFIFGNQTNQMIAASSAQSLDGTSDNDALLGFDGKNVINGGAGEDVLDGGADRDILTGGDGVDIFRFSHRTDSVRGTNGDRAYDRITDFEVGVDQLDISALGFTGIQFGSAAEGELRVHYSSNSDRTYVRDDHGSDFEFYLDGNYLNSLTESDFIFV